MDERTFVPSPAERPVGAFSSSAGPLPDAALQDPRALQILTTEHWSLLTARSLVYNEAFARAGMFLSFLAASLVALGLMSAAMGFSPEFHAVAVLILALDLFIGLATAGRVSTATAEDIRMLQGMNRLRHAYHETVPGLERYFITGRYDDLAGVFMAYNADVRLRSRRSIIHSFTTVVGMLVVIDAALAAFPVAAPVLLVGGSGAVAVAIAIVMFGVVLTLGVDWMTRTVAGTASAMKVEFPSPPQTATQG
jgi:hypothetical protein